LIEVDGSQKSGSGTILRLAVALSAITGEELHIYNIRKRRKNPGLRPQHLEAVNTAAKLCGAKLKGGVLNSSEVWFKPEKIEGGKITAEIGTAGSIPMLFLTVLPICVFARNEVELLVSNGGTDVRYSPTINYMRYVLLPVLGEIGLKSSLIIHKYGYYPKGMGQATLRVQPYRKLSSLSMQRTGDLQTVYGISVCTFLKDRKVADRQAEAAKKHLAERGISSEIDVIYDESNPLQKGSSIVLWTKTDMNRVLGADAIGELGKASEVVGKEAAEKLLPEISSHATVDIHLADMIVPYVAFAEGESVYFTRSMTDHLDTNIWLTEKILNVEFETLKMNGYYKIVKKE